MVVFSVFVVMPRLSTALDSGKARVNWLLLTMLAPPAAISLLTLPITVNWCSPTFDIAALRNGDMDHVGFLGFLQGNIRLAG